MSSRPVYENKAECVADIKRWAWDRAEDKAHCFHPKPAPMRYDNLAVPEDVERFVIYEFSGHNQEHKRKWEHWFNERLHHITQSLSVIGQMVNQVMDWNVKTGVFQYGRMELKAKLQADIDRLQALVNEL